MTDQTQLLDLPVDILYLIFPYLDVPSFVSLTSTCRALHQSSIAQYAAFWSTATRSTFRVPNQPVVENDGRRWQKMYRRLLTESRVFTWGSNGHCSLGHSANLGPVPRQASSMRRARRVPSKNVSWPTEMDSVESLGIIADMQCGGWSTHLLTSKGGLHSTGVMNGQTFGEGDKPSPEKLRYPAGLPHPSERYEPATAIRQFSAGRSHVLGLSDSGNIWSWSNVDLAALQIKFLDIDLSSSERISAHGYVKKVVAGWSKSTAYVVGTGIVVWDPVDRNRNNGDSEEDAAMVLENAVVPQTDFQRQVDPYRRSSSRDDVGVVENFICLEGYIVFNTDLGKVFAAKIMWDDVAKEISSIKQVPLVNDPESSSDSQFATDVQGSFRSFAIFTRNGAVLTGDDDHLDKLFSSTGTMKPLNRIPALQAAQVISVAFGDYHFHALHAPGYITSYGREPQGCGCLGLGGNAVNLNPEGRLRGLRYQAINGDAQLVPHAYLNHGRRIWFENDKKRWVTFLTSGGKDPEEARERMRMCAEVNVQGEVSEWVEQEGRAWEEKFGGGHALDNDGDGLSPYFALSVAAAGWHSGALVLVNNDVVSRISEGCLTQPASDVAEDVEGETEDDSADEHADSQGEDGGLVERSLGYIGDLARWFLGLPADRAPIPAAGPSFRNPNDPDAFSNPLNHGAAGEDGRPYVWAQDSFPRLKLADGREMPGTVDFCEWRYGRPDWKDVPNM